MKESSEIVYETAKEDSRSVLSNIREKLKNKWVH